MGDFTNMFASAFAKHDAIAGNQVNKSQAQILDINMLDSMPKRDAGSALPENNSVQKAYEKSKYPELAGKAKLVERKAEEARYNKFIKSLTEGEYKNLKLLSKGENLIFEINALKSLGEQDINLETSRLESFGLIKREKFDDIIEFRLLNKGRDTLRKFEQLLEKAKLNE